MAATDVTVQQDAGTPEQLPQGAASQLNESLPTKTASPPQDAQAAIPQAPMAEPADYAPKYVPATPDEEFILGPSTRPDEPVTEGVQQRSVAVPETLRRVLPALVDASNAPDAPETLRLIVQLLTREANK